MDANINIAILATLSIWLSAYAYVGIRLMRALRHYRQKEDEAEMECNKAHDELCSYKYEETKTEYAHSRIVPPSVIGAHFVKVKTHKKGSSNE